MMKKLKYTEGYLDARWFSFKKTYYSINNVNGVEEAFEWDSLAYLSSKFEQAYNDGELFEDYNLHLLGILTNHRVVRNEDEEEEWDEED